MPLDVEIEATADNTTRRTAGTTAKAAQYSVPNKSPNTKPATHRRRC